MGNKGRGGGTSASLPLAWMHNRSSCMAELGTNLEIKSAWDSF